MNNQIYLAFSEASKTNGTGTINIKPNPASWVGARAKYGPNLKESRSQGR